MLYVADLRKKPVLVLNTVFTAVYEYNISHVDDRIVCMNKCIDSQPSPKLHVMNQMNIISKRDYNNNILIVIEMN